jgi:hypothetical protein
MPTTTRREAQACPICGLHVTITHSPQGKTVEYDMAEWARLCRHPNTGSPLACPGLQPAVKTWLGKK